MSDAGSPTPELWLMSKQPPFEMAPDAGIRLLLYVGEDEMKMSELQAASPS